ncbi:MAG TPA: Asp-tRNA(Asn)/Glu-tRNA(Gln) amidotransferase subunit GatB [Chloroflexi bacterium]|nr:Asp-tRNA(Asn)/Glu-tRNA(Gln) amidotransferase subunit GatB [Chloroflexota bacterium]
MRYEPVIGLEVHAQIHTASKMFCGCPVVADTGDVPSNTAVCPVCTGMPGTLPVVNRRAVELTLLTCLALDCEVPPTARFARKSYFYPDLPKGYQISQHALPFGRDGFLEIETAAGPKRIRINNVHLEEDAGKLYHGAGGSRVDLNRAGVPLIEIVTEPDLRSVEEVRAYAAALHAVLVYLGVNGGEMERGVMRFEASVSVRPAGSDALNPRHEIKNLNSFRALADAVAYEIAAQVETLTHGGAVAQQTVGWDEARGVTYVQRSKEYAEDYRYFPEPDLPPVDVDRAWVAALRAQLPELPAARRERFTSDYGLSGYDAALLTADRAVADYYEAVVSAGGAPKAAANWITGELFRLMKETGQTIQTVHVSPQALAELIQLVETDVITLGSGKTVLAEMFAAGGSARQIVAARGLAQISDTNALEQVIARIVEENPEEVRQYLEGKEQILSWLMGQVMRATHGKANPQVVQRLLHVQLEARRQ